ncbi:hypothetical protein CF15_07075 [Pyrodictium occultum]|uniref:Methyltransferase type 11 domain-containing protein n=1 Tax=Pyrodictium occultum TaxID=2309 RepID=A0A0V8RWR5_PYROC|nr:methyltransferase domain-containing protein [Pyrodictium occultum]KSW12477.1 hypothetical protein CF15_07075 [Pyrodictium occultum]
MLGQRLLRVFYRRGPLFLHHSAAKALAEAGPRLVADIGSANALLARALEDHGYLPSYYLALDVDSLLLAAAPSRAWIERIQASAERLPLRGRAVDMAVLHDALHHFHRPWEALAEAARAAECILIDDIDAGRLSGKLVELAERLLGFPARFARPSEVAEKLQENMMRVVMMEADQGLPTYRMLACRAAAPGSSRARP